MGYTREEKQKYFAELRAEYARVKELAETDAAQALQLELERMGLERFSIRNAVQVQEQAKRLGLDGLPYIDFKTYDGWQQSGMQVRRGEKALIRIVVMKRIPKKKKVEGEEEFYFKPAMVSIFHRSQVDEVVEEYA